MHPIARRALLATAAATLTTTIATGAHAGAQTATTCVLAVHPFDDISRRLEVVHADGSTQVLLSIQDNRTTLGGGRTFEIPADVTLVHWTWNRAAGDWRVSLAVGANCAMEPYPYWTDGSHPASLSMTVGQVPTTTTVAPTTTTAPAPTTTTPPVTSTTGAPATTVPPQSVSVQRVTPTPTTEAATTAPQLPATGRRTWPQVRLSLALLAVGVTALQLARVMQQDDEMAEETE